MSLSNVSSGPDGPARPGAPDDSGPTAIVAAGLRKVYGTHEAVRGVDLTVRRGEIVGFLGPNGAGKTTTIKMLTGLLRPSSGQAFIMGHDVQREPVRAKASFGYVPDTPSLYGKLRGWEFLRFMGRLYRVPTAAAERRAAELLRLFELTNAASDLVEGYSHGMQQKLALAGAMLHDPPVLFLDEPTVGLDPRSARIMKDLLVRLRDRGTAVFFSTHILEIAERMCDRVAIIDRGSIVAAGTIAELRGESSGSLEDIFLRLTGGAEYRELAEVLA
ncbi:MAG: ABC transporter ATP-binding protein [Chloroflexota bacterium]|nr:ABC transporter ATP-binding protein [Chloroflexota bacterium]